MIDTVSPPARRFAIWMTAFLALGSAFYWIDGTQWFQWFLLRPYSIFLAGLAAALLNILGLQVQQVGPTLSAGAAHFEFAGSCTASLVSMLYAAAVLSFPVAWRSRLKGLLLGVPVIFVLNLARGVLIVFVASRFPAALWGLHIIVGQILVIGGVLAIFIWWAQQAQQGSALIHLPAGLPPLQIAGIFAASYLLFSLFYYNIFIQSELAGWARALIIHHSAAALSILMPAGSGGYQLLTPVFSLELSPACLRSPVVIIVMAVIAAWPACWWKKSLLIVIGFLPLFYAFNLMRVCAIVVSAPLDSANEHSFMHTYFGAMILISLFIGLGAYETSFRRQAISMRKFLALLAAGLIAAVILAGLCNVLYRLSLLPWVLQLLQGHSGLGYDPEQTISRMARVQAFIWVLGVALAPIVAIRRKAVIAMTGLAGFLFFSVAFVAWCTAFQLSPHIRLIKAATLGLPVIACLPMFLGSRKTVIRS